MNHRAWLDNFTPGERPYALSILSAFLYLSNPIIDAMLYGAVHSLSCRLAGRMVSTSVRPWWREFLSRVKFTYVQGETPGPTDSGYLFARKARQVLGIPERQIVDPIEALHALVHDPRTPVVFVDDFVGSGNQMYETWYRRWCLEYRTTSFAEEAKDCSMVVYVPLIATELGLNRLARGCRGLRVYPAHRLDARYSLISDDSILWPDCQRKEAPAVLQEASERAGIVANCEFGWKGICDLGLAIAFEESVPDATIPLVYWDQDGWRPLLRRR